MAVGVGSGRHGETADDQTIGDAMKRVILLLVLVLSMAAVAMAAPQAGTISGIAKGADNAILAGVKVQLRNVDTGALVATTQSGADGSFQFAGMPTGNYVVEIVDADGNVVGVSPVLSMTSGQTLSGITVSAGAIAGGTGSFFTSAAGIVTGLAVLGGVTAGIVVAVNGSSSK